MSGAFALLAWIGRKVAGLVRRARRPWLISPDWVTTAARAGHWPPGTEAWVRQMADVYNSSFCGECRAGPHNPHGRCPACLAKLGRLLEGVRAADRAGGATGGGE